MMANDVIGIEENLHPDSEDIKKHVSNP